MSIRHGSGVLLLTQPLGLLPAWEYILVEGHSFSSHVKASHWAFPPCCPREINNRCLKGRRVGVGTLATQGSYVFVGGQVAMVLNQLLKFRKKNKRNSLHV